jgi:hypothetical protein
MMVCFLNVFLDDDFSSFPWGNVTISKDVFGRCLHRSFWKRTSERTDIHVGMNAFFDAEGCVIAVSFYSVSERSEAERSREEEGEK